MLKGGNIVFTGKVHGMNRSTLERIVRDAGGYVSPRITQGVDLVVAAGWPHAHADTVKVQRARRLGIPIIGEVEFLRRLAPSPSTPTKPQPVSVAVINRHIHATDAGMDPYALTF